MLNRIKRSFARLNDQVFGGDLAWLADRSDAMDQIRRMETVEEVLQSSRDMVEYLEDFLEDGNTEWAEESIRRTEAWTRRWEAKACLA